jgi:hypothetical protein
MARTVRIAPRSVTAAQPTCTTCRGGFVDVWDTHTRTGYARQRLAYEVRWLLVLQVLSAA